MPPLYRPPLFEYTYTPMLATVYAELREVDIVDGPQPYMWFLPPTTWRKLTVYDPSAFAVGKVNMTLHEKPQPLFNVTPDAPCHEVTDEGNKSVRNDAAWLMLGL